MNAYQHLQLLHRFDRSFGLYQQIKTLINPGDKVLDAGCGLGVLSLWAAEAGASTIVAIDRDDLSIAKKLAEENGRQTTIQFHQADLHSLLSNNPTMQNSFDVIIAMVYFNDPRRDKIQSDLVFKMASQLLKPNGVMIPDTVKYYVSGCDWPSQDYKSRKHAIDSMIQEIEERYNLTFNCLADHINNTPYKEFFPNRNLRGRYECTDKRVLSKMQYAFDIRYSTNYQSCNYPKNIKLSASSCGIMNSLIWEQKLYSGNALLFSNQSLSWLAEPYFVRAGESIRVQLDNDFYSKNTCKAVVI